MPNSPVQFLLVDDVEANLIALEALLKRDGLKLLKARTGGEALELLLVQDIALAILDVQMPEMSGFELAELMRGAERTRRIPIIFVTAEATSSQRRFRGYELGAVDYLLKPIDPHILQSKTGVFFDLARQRNELRASEARFRQLADSMPHLVWTARPNGEIDYFNRRVREYRGAIQAETGIWDIKGLISPDDYAATMAAWEKSVSTGTELEVESRMRLEGGTFRYHLIRAQGGRDEHGVIAKWFGSCTDIDDQKRVQELLEKTVSERTAELREMVAELEAFSYSIAHDMRGPLRSLSGFSDLLIADHGEGLSQDAHGYLERIAASAKRMDQLITDVLSYSTIIQGQVPLRDVRLDELIVGVIDSYPNLKAHREGICVRPGLPNVIGNAAMLSQVFSNLLSNAIKFVKPGEKPCVDIWAEPQGVERARIFIRDHGIGIPADQHRKIFGMFQRVDPSYEGTGIGLSIVQKAVRRMGGEVGVISTPTEGSTFWILLPTAQQADSTSNCSSSGKRGSINDR